MTQNKKSTLILSLILCVLMCFGAFGIISVNKAHADGYPFRYDDAVNDKKLEKYYMNHWSNGQDQRVYGETSGKWSFGKAILHTDSQTYSYTKATHNTTEDANDSRRYKTGSPHQYEWGFKVMTDVMSGNTNTAYQTVFAWEAEEEGTVKFTGFYSRRKAGTDLIALAKAQTIYTDFWLPGVNFGENANGFTAGEDYTTGMFKYSPSAAGNKLTCLNYKGHNDEYVWVVDPTIEYSVKAGDIIFFGLLCTNKGSLTDGWNTHTLALFSSQFTATAPVNPAVTLSVGLNGSVLGVTNGQTFTSGSQVSINVVADAGYAIDTLTWGGNTITAASNLSNYRITETITENTNLTVTFKPATYVVSVTNDSTMGTITGITNGQTFSYNQTATITITPNAGYEITSATWNGASITGFDKAGFTFGQAITSTTELIVSYSKIQYSLSVTNNTAMGTISGATSKKYDYNTPLSITVTPVSGYKITSVKWNGADVAGFNATGFSFNKTMTEDSTLVVTYEAIKFLITITNDSSKGSVNYSTGEQAMNSNLRIEITPNEGYEIASVSWGAENITISDPSGFFFFKTVDGDKELVVTYRSTIVIPDKVNYNVTLAKYDTKMGRITGAGTYEEGSMVTILITANEGYKIKSVKDGNDELRIPEKNKTNYEYEFVITASTRITVEFEADVNSTVYKNGAACLNSINGGEYVAVGALGLALAGLLVVKLRKKEQ